MESLLLKNIVEAALLAAGGPLTIDQLRALFGENDGPERKEIKAVLKTLEEDYEGRGIELLEVASGYRVQVRESMGQWLGKLWEERPPRYSRALLETLSIIAYRQPVTRGDIEEIRGVAVSSNIIRTLLEREWIKVVGHRDVPGKPAMFGSTRLFLDYFGLKKLEDLPPLAELASLEPVAVQLELGTAEAPGIALTEEGAGDTTEGSDGEAQVDEQHEAQYDDEVAEDIDAAADDIDEDQDAANIASIDDARAASEREPETDFNAERAEVVPLKNS